MKKRLFILFIVVVMLIAAFTVPTSASQSTSYTYTLSVNGEWIRTQDAYMPAKLWFRDGTLNAAEDIFFYNNLLYIADTGNGRIVVLNVDTGEKTEIINEEFVNPCGIFVNEEAVFVADRGAETVFKIDFNGSILMRLDRPDSYLFSQQSQYIPKNVAVTSQGIIFVCGLGAYEGLMQFDSYGVFQGYFAANSTKITFLERIEELLFTEEQMAQLLTRTPNPIYNIDISERDMVYSVTQLGNKSAAGSSGNGENAVKYYNMAGDDVLSKGKIEDEHNFTDIAALPNGISAAVTNSGIIYIYDDSGNVIFSFGGRTSEDRNGLFTYAEAIDVDNNGRLYVLDREGGYVQVFYPTDFANQTYTALYNISNGSYADSESTWKELLRLNGMSLIAHKGYGKVLYQQQRFKEAAEQFKIIGDKQYYSECMWEIRNKWFQDNLVLIIFLIVGAVLLYYAVKLLSKKRKINFSKTKSNPFWSRLKIQVGYITGMIRHPLDEFYYIKRDAHGSVLSATIIYILVFVIYMLDTLARSFTFSMVDINSTSVLSVAIIFLMPLILYVLGNRMVSTINEGEGNLKKIYVATAYSLTPYLLLGPVAVALTYVLTLNETIIINLIWWASVIWSAALIFMSVKEIHNYNLRETIKILLITLFFMIMAVIVMVIVYVIELQTIIFVKDLINEVVYNVSV